MDKIQRLKSYLGKPYYESEFGVLYAIDCIEALSKISDPIIDLTITSPPYNIGKEYEEIVAVDRYIEWCSIWLKKIYEVTKANGALWLNLGYLQVSGKGKAVPIPYLLWNKSSFYLIQEIVWNYAAGVAAKRSLSPRNEKILWYVKNEENYIFNLDDIRDKNVKYPNQKKNGKLKCNPLGKNPTDVWQITKVTSGTKRSSKERTPHPAQFPIAMIDRIVKGSSNEEEVVLDPFIGSGTTAVSAIKNNRKFIGFDVKKSYLDIAIKRIEDSIKPSIQEDLFTTIKSDKLIQISI